ncbi:hypothetical protein ACFZCK_22900 [Kitasatospora purpeofusca]|uniref:MmyB family transcriptional regulator n=1 Tax=Kitasatospora purpeofusca TaxID=67352 RepID=UPI0036EF7CA0
MPRPAAVTIVTLSSRSPMRRASRRAPSCAPAVPDSHPPRWACPLPDAVALPGCAARRWPPGLGSPPTTGPGWNRPPSATARPRRPGPVPAATLAVLDTLDAAPAFVTGPTFDLPAWNRPDVLLPAGPERRPPHERNLLWPVFCCPYRDRSPGNTAADGSIGADPVASLRARHADRSRDRTCPPWSTDCPRSVPPSPLSGTTTAPPCPRPGHLHIRHPELDTPVPRRHRPLAPRGGPARLRLPRPAGQPHPPRLRGGRARLTARHAPRPPTRRASGRAGGRQAAEPYGSWTVTSGSAGEGPSNRGSGVPFRWRSKKSPR